MTAENEARFIAKHDVFRQTSDFSDLLKIVASYYDMYSRAVNYIAPWISRQHGKTFIPLDKDEIKMSIGKERPTISFRARSAFIDSAYKFIMTHKGKKTLITPSPSSHHSAQFTIGTFSITPVPNDVTIFSNKIVRRKARTLHRIDLAGAEQPVFIEDLKFNPSDIKHVIIRPKLAKLGMPSATNWEVLLFNKPFGYIIEHVDSHTNPRYAGIM